MIIFLNKLFYAENDDIIFCCVIMLFVEMHRSVSNRMREVESH